MTSLALEIESELARNVAEAWFPRCIDPEGGYRENFSRDWRYEGDSERSLVFQSRMLWFTGRMAERDSAYRNYCEHGLRLFLDQLAEKDGVLKTRFALDGRETSDVRSSYSLAFAVFGLSAAARALDSSEALGLAQATFGYLERCHKDPGGRGYFEMTDLAGELGADLRKSQNPHLHLLEAFTELYKVCPSPLVRQRLAEMVAFMTEELFTEPGYLDDYVMADGARGDGSDNFGHDVEVAHLLVTASEALRGDPSRAHEVAVRLMDHALLTGWDEEAGGFLSGRSADGSLSSDKVWWVQFEGLVGLATLYKLTGETRYRDALVQQWSWIREHQLDPEFTGVFPGLRKAQVMGTGYKGSTWKAAYHDGRAFLDVPTLLRSV